MSAHAQPSADLGRVRPSIESCFVTCIEKPVYVHLYTPFGDNYFTGVICILFPTLGGDQLLRLQRFNFLAYFEAGFGRV